MAIPGISVAVGIDTTQFDSGVRRVANQTNKMAATMQSAARGGRAGFNQLGLQLQDVIVQLQAGTSAFTVFAQQGSQIAGAFGPIGAGVGVAIAAIGALGGILFNLGEDADKTAKRVDDLINKFKELGEQDTAISRLVSELATLGAEAGRFAEERIEIDIVDAQANLRQLQQDMDEFIQNIPVRQGFAQLFGERLPGLDMRSLTAMRQLAEEVANGKIEAIDLADRLREIAPALMESIPDLEKQFLAMATALRTAKTEAEALAAAARFRAAERTPVVNLLEPREEPRLPRLPPLAAVEARFLEGVKPPEPTKRTTFADIIGPLEEENALLREGLLTREEVRAVLQAEKQLDAELTEEQKRRLSAAIRTGEAIKEEERLLKEMQQTVKQQEKLSENQTDNIREQLAETKLLNQFGGRETEAYRTQLGLLKLKAAGVEFITDEQRALNRELQREITARQRQQALLDQKLDRQRLEREMQLGSTSGGLSEMLTGLPPEEFRVQEALARQQAIFGGEVPAGIEESIRQTERLRTVMGLMQTTAEAAGEALSDVAMALISGEDPTVIVQQMIQELARLALQAAITELALVAMHAAFAGMTGPTGSSGLTRARGPNTTGAGGAGFSYTSFGGPRQHGGPVSAGQAYLVGEQGREVFVPNRSGSIIPNRSIKSNEPPNIGADFSYTSLGGSRQHGGPVSAGQAYLVGERGREIFVPNRSGSIIPNSSSKSNDPPNITIIDQRGKGAPPIETSVDARGIVSMLVRSEVSTMGSDGSLGRLTGTRRPGTARG